VALLASLSWWQLCLGVVWPRIVGAVWVASASWLTRTSTRVTWFVMWWAFWVTLELRAL
jgi:hypothetical protein